MQSGVTHVSFDASAPGSSALSRMTAAGAWYLTREFIMLRTWVEDVKYA